MPDNKLSQSTKVLTLSNEYTIEFDYENQWATLLLTFGPRLNFSPETILRLREFFDEVFLVCEGESNKNDE